MCYLLEASDLIRRIQLKVSNLKEVFSLKTLKNCSFPLDLFVLLLASGRRQDHKRCPHVVASASEGMN
jgi:hypothetical protein